MPVRVEFRFNKLSGEVEEFIVDDQDRSLPEAEHDRIAEEVASVIARAIDITEVTSEVRVHVRQEAEREPVVEEPEKNVEP